MNRRSFLTRSAAFAAAIVLPKPGAASVSQADYISGVIRDQIITLKEATLLVLDGPLEFIDCRLINDVPEAEYVVGIYETVQPLCHYETVQPLCRVALLLSNSNQYKIDFVRCQFESSQRVPGGNRPLNYSVPS